MNLYKMRKNELELVENYVYIEPSTSRIFSNGHDSPMHWEKNTQEMTYVWQF